VGQVIEVDGVKGRIIQIANISVTLLVGEDEVIIPTHKLHVEKVVVYKES
jgi:hypothetical protein